MRRARGLVRNRFEVMIHDRDADWQGVVESEANIANTVADEDNIHDRISDARCNRVVSGGHCDPPPLLLPLLNKGYRNSLGWRLRRVAHLGPDLFLNAGTSTPGAPRREER